MAFPVTPLDAIFELYAGKDWQDVTEDVYLRDGVTINHGRANESPSAEPGSISLTLNNRHGKYSPRNPTSPYFGTLGRNSPLRVSIRDNEDQFERTVVGGWGSTPAGDAWSSTAVGSPTFSVGSGKGLHEINTTNSYALSYLPDRLYKDVDVTVKVKVNGLNGNLTGGEVEPANIVLRGESITDYFLVRVKIKPTGPSGDTVAIEIRHETSGAIIAPEVTIDRITTEHEFSVRAQIEGQTIRAKAWDHDRVLDPAFPDLTPYEPLDWDITGHTGDFYEGQKGWVGIRSGVATGVTNSPPIGFEYDDLQVTIPRGTWEVADWPVKWDVSGKDVYVPIQGAGVMRRLGQGAPAIRSAVYRAMTNPAKTPPLAYWTCEDGADAEVLANAVPGGQPLRFGGGPVTTVQKASFTGFTSSAALPVLGGPLGAYLEGDVPKIPGANTTTIAHAYMLMAVPEAGVSATCQMMNLRTVGARSGEWMIEAQTDGALRLHVRDWVGNDILTSDPIAFDVNGELCMVILTLDQPVAGPTGSVDWTITVIKVGDPLGATFTDTLAGHGIGRPRNIAIGFGGATNGTAFGHVAVDVVDATPLVLDTAAALNAYTGAFPETHLARMVRLTAAEQIPFAYYGDEDDAALAGAQRQVSVVDILKQGAEADAGLLSEARGAAAATYRTRTSLYNQTGLALDYEAGDISPPFEPVDDDQQTRNDITVKRIDGSSVQVTQETGALSVQPPPVGVGRYDSSVELSLDNDDQLPDQAGWRLFLGTVDEARYPSVRVNLAARPSLIRDVTSLADGDRLTIANLPAWMPPDLVDLIVVGYVEVLGTKSWDVTFTCLPGSPYQVTVLDDANYRVGTRPWYIDRTAASFAPLSTSATTFVGRNLFVENAATVWTTAGGQMPIPILAAGELMNITAISAGGVEGATFTVTRSVNGVVKEHAHLTPFTLAKRSTIPL